VQRLFRRIDRAHGRLDVAVSCIAGEDPLMGQWASFWDVDARNADAILRQAFTSHVLTAKHAAKRMIAARRGLIVEVTESDTLGAGGNPFSQAVKIALKTFALNMATELKRHRVAAVAITPGFLRSESMLERFGVDEASWRKGGERDPNFLVSESPLYVGRAVAALAADPKVLARTGQLWSSWALARDYGFTDEDGTRPDWGRHDIDFGKHPGWLLEYIRTGCELQLEWLGAVSRHTRSLLRQLPAA
jgi:NAD(P)-dependent dehydrogenase (short-subunit alcohol dehydrogenase family)